MDSFVSSLEHVVIAVQGTKVDILFDSCLAAAATVAGELNSFRSAIMGVFQNYH